MPGRTGKRRPRSTRRSSRTTTPSTKYPQLQTAYFFLGNSYDQLYKPAKQGDATNDAYIQKAIENYRKAADKNTDKAWKKSSLEYLSAAYGSDKLNDPAKAEPVYQEIIALDPNEPGQLHGARQALRGRGPLRRRRGAVRQGQGGQAERPVASWPASPATTTGRGTSRRRSRPSNRPPRSSPTTPRATTASPSSTGTRPAATSASRTREKRDYIQKGLAMEDKALGLNPDYMEAMTYKNILLRLKANITKDPAEQKRLIEEADKLRNRVIDAQKRKQTGKG